MPIGYALDLVNQLIFKPAVDKLLPRMVNDFPRWIDDENVPTLAQVNVAAQILDDTVVEVYQKRSPLFVGSLIPNIATQSDNPGILAGNKILNVRRRQRRRWQARGYRGCIG
jgi:hypothetical protein